VSAGGIAILALVTCLAGFAAVRYLPSGSPARQTSPAPALPTDDSSKTVGQDKSPKVSAQEYLEQEIVSYDQNDTHIHVFNALAKQWGARPIKAFSEGLDIPDMFRRIAAKRNLRVTLFNGSLDEVIRFDLPFIAVTRVTGELGEYCYAVTSAQNGSLVVYPTLLDRQALSQSELAAVTNGTYYLVWQNFGQIPDTLSSGEKRSEIRGLQQLLKQAGFYQDPINGIYGASTAAAVRKFQQSIGIPANDSLGELTLAALSRYDTNHKVPSLKGS
jgi:hypothetical protein